MLLMNDVWQQHYMTASLFLHFKRISDFNALRRSNIVICDMNNQLVRVRRSWVFFFFSTQHQTLFPNVTLVMFSPLILWKKIQSQILCRSSWNILQWSLAISRFTFRGFTVSRILLICICISILQISRHTAGSRDAPLYIKWDRTRHAIG